MKVLVTGANGFMGSNLVEKLIEARHSVRAMVLKGTNEDLLQNLDCEIVYGDVLKPETIKEALKDIELVYHLAALPSNAWTKKIVEVNYKGTVNIFNEASRMGIKRFVYMSSLVVHGFKNFENADENTPLIKPKWYKRPYIKSKILSEQFLREQNTDMEIIIIRPGFLPFGPNDMLATKELLSRFEEGKSVPNINQGKAKICYIYVSNLCDALILAGTHPNAAGQTYLIADNNPPYITMADFNEALCKELGCKPSGGSIPYALATPFVALLDLVYRLFMRKKLPLISMYTLKVAKYNLYFQSEKAKEELGFNPKISFDQAIKQTVDWYKKYF